MKKKIVLIVKDDKKAKAKAEELSLWLKEKGVIALREEEASKKDKDIFCVFVLGGDGTFLKAANWIGKRGIPIIGTKFGGIGFLTNLQEDKMFDAAEEILKQNFSIEKRTKLTFSLIRNKETLITEDVLNDVVISRDKLSRVVDLDTYADGNYITTYRGDGLIFSSPTGSTAYSLAAGGPILYPTLSCIVVTPICPFTLTNRPLILSDNSQIEVVVETPDPNLVISLDGQKSIRVLSKDRITVKKSSSYVSMIKLANYNYFQVLKTKLRWGGGKI